MKTTDLTMIREHLKQLKLLKMERRLDEVLSWAEKQNQPLLPVLNRLFEIEATDLITRRIERRIKESRLPERKLLSDFDFDFQTGIDKKQIMGLATLDFVERKEGIILAGNSGTGKSHIAKALLFLGCQKLYRCRYTKACDMLKHLMSGLPDDSLEQKLKTYTQPDILLIDELGFDRIEQQAAHNASLFFKVIDARYGKSSTWMTTNIGFEALGDYLADPVVTTSIVDRMVHHAIIISVEGPSYRIHESKKLNRNHEKSNGADP
ncbi:MAG: IS21-like element helper ATPase IstB [Desulfatirhabdiaceae bacterium]|nr:IS21-like element helper ATPase IstB [Desulfatirhabdiaceae bacterium]